MELLVYKLRVNSAALPRVQRLKQLRPEADLSQVCWTCTPTLRHLSPCGHLSLK